MASAAVAPRAVNPRRRTAAVEPPVDAFPAPATNGHAPTADQPEAAGLVPGSIAWLPPTALLTGDYQRALRMTRVKRMARDFDPRRAKVLLVTERDGAIYLIDGQHRAAAAVEAGRADVPMPCLVVSTSSYADEAELFVQANDRNANVPVTPGEIFHARLEQGDPVALAIAAITRELGLDLDLKMQMSTRAESTVRAIATLQRIYRQGGPEQLRDVLETIMSTFSAEREGLTHYVLQGFHQFLYRYHTMVDRPRLHRIARAHGVNGLHARVAMRRISDNVTGADAGMTLGKVLHQIYNEDAPPKLQLPAWERAAAVPSVKLAPAEGYFQRQETFVPADRPLATRYRELLAERTERQGGGA